MKLQHMIAGIFIGLVLALAYLNHYVPIISHPLYYYRVLRSGTSLAGAIHLSYEGANHIKILFIILPMVGALIGIIWPNRISVKSASALRHLIASTVTLRHLLAGLLAGCFVFCPYLFIASMDEWGSMSSNEVIRSFLGYFASVSILSATGAALLVVTVFSASDRKNRPSIGWAILGGLLGPVIWVVINIIVSVIGNL